MNLVAIWPSVNVVGQVKKGAIPGAWLQLRWVTFLGYAILLCNQPLRPTQTASLSGTGSEYWPRGSGSVLWLGR